MKPARLILLLVALIAGGLAAFLVTRGGSPTTQVVTNEVVRQEAKTQILVAKGEIGVGERLTPQTVEWQDWPEGAVRPEYVTIAAMPNAPTDLDGAVARFEFFPGEPIRDQKLVRAEQGYLSAVLSKGMRGVSVPVTATASAGGYVVPNDHVDVLLTSQGSDGGATTSELVLSNVRVLAIGNRLGEVGASGGAADADPDAGPQAQIFVDDSIATLELTPGQAETLVNASSRGQLSLALRSVTDFGATASVAEDGTTSSIRLIRAGKQQNVMAGVGRPAGDEQAGVEPTNYTPQPTLPTVPPQAVAK